MSVQFWRLAISKVGFFLLWICPWVQKGGVYCLANKNSPDEVNENIVVSTGWNDSGKRIQMIFLSMDTCPRCYANAIWLKNDRNNISFFCLFAPVEERKQVSYATDKPRQLYDVNLCWIDGRYHFLLYLQKIWLAQPLVSVKSSPKKMSASWGNSFAWIP